MLGKLHKFKSAFHSVQKNPSNLSMWRWLAPINISKTGLKSWLTCSLNNCLYPPIQAGLKHLNWLTSLKCLHSAGVHYPSQRGAGSVYQSGRKKCACSASECQLIILLWGVVLHIQQRLLRGEGEFFSPAALKNPNKTKLWLDCENLKQRVRKQLTFFTIKL